MESKPNNFGLAIAKLLLITLMFQSVSFSEEPVKSKTKKFIVIGDTQRIGFWESLYWDYWNEHNGWKTKTLFKEIAKREPNFIIHLGDLTKDGSCPKEWHEFDLDNKPVFEKKITYYPIFGNHEYWGSTSDLYENFYKRFSHLKGKKWYSFSYEQIGFILINSNFNILSDDENTEQKKWYLIQLEEMEKNDSIKKIIVAGHHPPFTNSTIVSPNADVLKYFANPFIRSEKGLFFFSGHCHSYERFERNGKIFIVSGGGGGPRQKLEIDKNKRVYNDLFDGKAIRFFHFCEVEILKDAIVLKVIKLNDKNSFSVAEELKLPLIKKK